MDIFHTLQSAISCVYYYSGTIIFEILAQIVEKLVCMCSLEYKLPQPPYLWSNDKKNADL